jgi:Uma2 family endonuclease
MIGPALNNGDRMKQPEFHRRYARYPEDTKFELIGGTVYIASPLGRTHSRFDGAVGLILELYSMATPGTEVLHNATTVLGEESEPQPDLGLCILPEYGGRALTNADDIVEGAPELLAEIAVSSRAIDLHQKRDDYRQAGVREYLVVSVEEGQLHWFDFANDAEITPNRQGVYRSRTFPGLWVEGAALLARDSEQTQATLRRGLASREHAAFVRRLRVAYQPPEE